VYFYIYIYIIFYDYEIGSKMLCKSVLGSSAFTSFPHFFIFLYALKKN